MKIKILKRTVSFLIIALLVFTQAGILSLAGDSGESGANVAEEEQGNGGQNETDEPNAEEPDLLPAEEPGTDGSPGDGPDNGGDTYEAEASQEDAVTADALAPSDFAIVTPAQNKTYGEAPFMVETSLGGTGNVTFALANDDVVKLKKVGNNAEITIIGTGAVVITATKAADDTYQEGIRTVTVTVAKKEITINSSGSVVAKTYDGTTAATVTGITFSGLAYGETLKQGEDYEVSGAVFDTADAGVNKDVTGGTVQLLSGGPKAKNYTLSSGALSALKGTVNPLPIGTATLKLDVPVAGAPPQAIATTQEAAYAVINTAWSGNMDGDKFAGGTVYSAVIKLSAAPNRMFTNGFAPKINGGTVSGVTISAGGGMAEFKVTFPATLSKAVTGITVVTQPKLMYTAGDKLNLSALVVKVTYGDGGSGDIKYANLKGATYEINGKAVANGDILYAGDNFPIKIMYGGITETIGNIVVYSMPQLYITASDITDTSAIIAYGVTGTHNLKLLKLQVKSGSTWTEAAVGGPSYDAKGLKASTSYEYRVVGVENDAAEQEYTASVKFKTAAAKGSGIAVKGEAIDATQPLNGIDVTLGHGDTVIAVKKAVYDAVSATYPFEFANVANGVYNITADNGTSKVTQAVTISNGKITSPKDGIKIHMLTGNRQSAVENGGSAPNVAADGLSKLLEPGAGILGDDDLATLNGGGMVKIALEAGKKTPSAADKSRIDSFASSQTIGLYLDISVVKSRFELSNGSLVLKEITELTALGNNFLTITFELPDDLKNKKELTVYRVHAGKAEKLPKSGSGEKAVVSGNIVTLTASKFSTYAVGYTAGSGRSSSSGSYYRSYTRYDTTHWIGTSEARDLAKSAWNTGSDYARSRDYDIVGIRKSALKELSGMGYRHDTTDGASVQVRLYIGEPEFATKDILVSGYVTGSRVDMVSSIFKKWYDNDFAVVSMDQQGSFGMTVQIAAKVDLRGMDTGNLYFYSYNVNKNSYTQIKTEYRIDSNGYLHFATTLGGDIIISDGPLGEDEDGWMPGPDQSWIELNNPTTGGGPMTYRPAPAVTEQAAPLVLEAMDLPAVAEPLGPVSPNPAISSVPAPSEINTQSPYIFGIKKDLLIMGAAGIAMLLLAVVMKLWSDARREDIR